jgi:O-antigen/teichoic acid export membrane protein
VSDEFQEPSEGNSPAAWTAVIIMLVAFAIGTVAFVLGFAPVVWAAAGLLVVGLIVGLVLSRMGYGVYGPKHTPKEH